MIEVIGDAEGRLVAGSDKIGEAELALVLRQNQRDRPALRNDRDRSRGDGAHMQLRPDRDTVMDVNQAHIVGPAQRDAVAGRSLRQSFLQGLALRAAVRETARVDEGGSDSSRSDL